MMNDSTTSLKVNMRKLWSDHVIWTRLYIISAVAGPHGVTDVAEHLPLGEAGAVVASTAQAALNALPMSDADAAAGRLLKNQDDLGNAIIPYYGKDAGEKLTALLKQHIMRSSLSPLLSQMTKRSSRAKTRSGSRMPKRSPLF